MPISSGATSTSSVTAQSRNRCGQTALPNAALVRCSICTRIAALPRGFPKRPSQSRPPRLGLAACN